MAPMIIAINALALPGSIYPGIDVNEKSISVITVSYTHLTLPTNREV